MRLMGAGFNDFSEWTATRMMWMLRWGVRFNVVMIVITVAIWYLSDDALHNYLEHSTYRKNRDSGVVQTLEQEVDIFQKAVVEVLN